MAGAGAVLSQPCRIGEKALDDEKMPQRLTVVVGAGLVLIHQGSDRADVEQPMIGHCVAGQSRTDSRSRGTELPLQIRPEAALAPLQQRRRQQRRRGLS